ncbi:MAG: O-antigen ligase family protein [Actinomycetota bacterium]
MAEYLYVVALLGFLTQGPVLKIWEASGAIDSSIIGNTKFATYLVVQIPAIVLLFRRGIPRRMLVGPVGLVLAFCGWMSISTLWSTFSSYTLVESFTLTVTCLAGLYIATSFTLLQQLTLFLVAMQPGLLVSWFAVRNSWSGATNFEENYWIGIYFNRNSFAPPAALGLLAAVSLLWIFIVRRPKHGILVVFALLDVVLLDAALLLRSKSSTSLGAIGVFAFVWAFWTAMRWLNRRRKFTADQLAQLVYPGFLLTLIVLTWISFYSSSILSDFFKSDLDFNGRILLWRFSWDGFLDRPLAGWGWFAAWHTHNFFQEREFLTSLSSMTWSHSGIMDILLGGGIIGGALFVAAVVWSGARQLSRVFTQTAGQWSFAAVWFVIAASTQESFIVGNHFLWLLLVSALAGSRSESRRV